MRLSRCYFAAVDQTGIGLPTFNREDTGSIPVCGIGRGLPDPAVRFQDRPEHGVGAYFKDPMGASFKGRTAGLQPANESSSLSASI